MSNAKYVAYKVKMTSLATIKGSTPVDQFSAAEKDILHARLNLELQRLDAHFETWAAHHDPTLKHLYSKFVSHSPARIRYDDFVYAAYRCTIHI